MGLETVPCLRIEHMTPAKKRAYVLADNKLALNAGRDEDLLAEELEALSSLDLDFDLTITGFSIAEIDGLIEANEPGSPGDDEVVAKVLRRVRPGDVWALGI